MKNKQYQNETPYQTLNRLNNLFNYYESNQYEPRSIKSKMGIKHFSLFEIPKAFQNDYHVQEYQDTHPKISLVDKKNVKSSPISIIKKYSKEEKMWSQHMNIMNQSKDFYFQIQKDFNLTQKHSKYKFTRQIRERKPFSEQKDLQYKPETQYSKEKFAQLLRNGSAPMINIGNELKRRKQMEIDVNQQVNLNKNFSEIKQLVKLNKGNPIQNFENKLLKQNIFQQISTNNDQRKRENSKHQTEQQEWNEYFKNNYKRHFQRYDLSRETQTTVNKFHSLISQYYNN